MFEYFKKYRYIIVVGPQRSGTTIIAHMIGCDTGKVVLDEVNIRHSHIRDIPAVLRCEKSCVLQAPHATPWIPIFTDDDTAIVFCKRDVREIERSLVRSRTPRGTPVSQPFFSPQQAWDLWNRVLPMIDHPYEVYYEDIKIHPMYIPEKERNWTHKSIDKTNKRYIRIDYGKKDK
jgi:hypothetical protein